jgi:hypothetical protein
MNGITAASDVARSGAAAVLFAASGAVRIWLVERSSRFYRTSLARIWNWGLVGLVGLVGLGGLIALAVSVVMALTGTTFR